MTDVYANGREVSGKATPNKTISALPDVCLSPPPPPAGPVPIPYPNFGTASDTSDGCTSVFVKGKEAGKKNASKYSSIKGDEPATRSFGGSVVSHTITGTLKFAAYSFDVLFEGEGAERFMDLTTTNHMNPGGGASTSVARPRPPKPPSEAECKQMRADLAKERETLSGATADKRATKGTIAIAKPSNGGRQFSASGQLMRDKLSGNPNGYIDPKPARHVDGKGRPSKVCGGRKHHHPSGGSAKHCEAQSVDTMSWEPGPSKITFAIDYPAITFKKDKLGRTRKIVDQKAKDRPCQSCRRLLKKACECGVKIFLCMDDGPVDWCKEQGFGKGGG